MHRRAQWWVREVVSAAGYCYLHRGKWHDVCTEILENAAREETRGNSLCTVEPWVTRLVINDNNWL